MFRLLMCLLLLASCVFVEVELRKVGRKFKVKKVRNKLAKKKPEAKPTTYFYNYVDDTSLSWENASYYCQDRWGVVVTIPDQQTQDYIAGWLTRENIAGPVYLGIEKYEKKGGGRGWRFFNETEVEYTNWAPGEPNEESNRCAVISAVDRFQWVDYPFSGGAGFICQYDCKRDPFWCVRGTVVHSEDSCTCDCEERWSGPLCDKVDAYVDPLYAVGPSKASFADAELSCEEIRTTLPSVKTSNLWRSLQEFVSKRASLYAELIYIDLRLVDGVWVDSDGKEPEISKWLNGEPAPGKECAVISGVKPTVHLQSIPEQEVNRLDSSAIITSPADAYRWISVNCEEEHKYMCNFQCTKGYEKWCVHGDIIINDDGACTCQCWPGSYGDRCQEYDYNDVISKTILFFETQRSGRLPPDNRIPWRGDSALNDTGYNGEDLTGGWYDAGDHIKVTFKHTASVWKLALAFLEFGDAYRVAGQADYLYDTLIWGNNYTMKLHTKPNEFYVHVADPKLDHSYWGRPEDMTMDRPAYPSNETHPATEVAGNGVASLAASYLVFKDVNKPYADELLRHARELFNFADKFRGTCQENIPELEFKGGAYEDELTNAALWMYLATNETSYLDAAKEFYDGIKRKKTDALFTRNRLTIALQLMMYLTTKDEKYLKPFVDGLARWGPSKCMYTRKGLAMYTWNRPMKRAADISFIALIAAKHGIQSEDNFNFARSQIHYILGDGGRSYLTGFGRYPPIRPHHRGASCPDLPAPCGGKERNTANPSPQTLYGGLVGGPDERECYFDHRRNYEQNEAGINVAAFQGAVAGLSHFRMRRSNAN